MPPLYPFRADDSRVQVVIFPTHPNPPLLMVRGHLIYPLSLFRPIIVPNRSSRAGRASHDGFALAAKPGAR